MVTVPAYPDEIVTLATVTGDEIVQLPSRLENWTESPLVGAPDPVGEQLQFDAVLNDELRDVFQVQTLAEALVLRPVSARPTAHANQWRERRMGTPGGGAPS
jgi:hypothetical protein